MSWLKKSLASGELYIWMTAGGASLSLLMIAGLLALIMINGLGSFWPNDIVQAHLQDGTGVLGQSLEEELIPGSKTEARPEGQRRVRFRVGNRDSFGQDFRWVDQDLIVAQGRPADVVVLERREWGPVYGHLKTVHEGDRILAEGSEAWPVLQRLIRRTNDLQEEVEELEHRVIGRINHELEVLRLQARTQILKLQPGEVSPPSDPILARETARLEEAYRVASARLDGLYQEAARYHVVMRLSSGEDARVPLAQIIRAIKPNALSWFRKAGVYAGNLWEFLSGDPREANTEGGIFPAIFGTVMMVLLMTIVVMPFGVMAAIYLREYATQGPFVQTVRIAVNNLAGVPSIVFGVFGLGFFVYAMGGTIDALWYPEALPTPTFGTGGILWASLTLALLTVPVVIVATEEGLSAVPREYREGSVALGATKLETIWQVVLPCALPGVLTGLILAMARAAGEVAPLMLTGVVKLAPALPLDGYPPFLHLDRKFMHLGFHIYDVGFQSPNVEAAKPMVYMTTLTLIVVVVALNLLAVTLRNRLRRRYTGSAV